MPNVLSNDFNKVWGCFDGGMVARAGIHAPASDSVGEENKKTRGGGESFHRYHVGAAFLLVYLFSFLSGRFG